MSVYDAPNLIWLTFSPSGRYTRSTTPRKGQKPQILETKHDISHDHVKIVKASDEGTYEVVAIKDKYCAFSTLRADGGTQKQAQKQIKYQ